jgi:hypothetical protein
MKMLLSHLCAFPQLAKTLIEFTVSETPIHGPRGFLTTSPRTVSSDCVVEELAMLLKYVEPNGNSSDPIQWSIRQQLLFQSRNNKSWNEKYLLIRPSAAFRSRIIDEFMHRGGIACHWTNLPQLLISSLPAHWQSYIKSIDEKIWHLVSCGRMAQRATWHLVVADNGTGQVYKFHKSILTHAW